LPLEYNFIAESNIFLLQLLFSPLEVFDIATRNVPTKGLSLVIANWVETSQKPAVTSIALAIPHFAFKSRAARHGTVPLSLDPFRIIGMIYIAAEAFEPLLKSKAEVIKRRAVGKQTLAAGSENSDELWCEVQDLPELCFLPPDRFFGNLAYGDVGYRPDDLDFAR